MAIDVNAFADAYRTENIDGLRALNVFDGLRIRTWEASIERAGREKNPTDRYGMLQKVWSDIRQSGEYFAGADELGASMSTLGLDGEAELNLCVNVGRTLVDKVLG